MSAKVSTNKFIKNDQNLNNMLSDMLGGSIDEYSSIIKALIKIKMYTFFVYKIDLPLYFFENVIREVVRLINKKHTDEKSQ